MTIDRKDLLEGLQAVMPATAARSTKPILSCVLIDGQTLHATDLEIGIRYALRGDTGLKCCVRPDKLAAILKECGGETIEATTKGDVLTVRTASGKFNLTTSPADEFPAVETPEGEWIPANDLAGMFRRTTFAADRKESGARWAVTGVLIECDGKAMNVVATDTKRLALCTVECAAEKATALVPAVACAMVERLAAGDLSMMLTKSAVAFERDGVLIVSRLVEGRFPPFKEILPKKSLHRIALNREQFQASIRQSAVMVDKESSRMEFEFSAGAVKIRSTSAEQGDSEVVMSLAHDIDMTIAFDPSYLLDFLKSTDAAEVTLELTSAEKPAVFVVDGGYKYLVMPLAG